MRNDWAPRCAVSFVTCEQCGELWTRRTRSGRAGRCCRQPDCRKAYNAERMRRLNREHIERTGVSLFTAFNERHRDRRRAEGRVYAATVGYTEAKRSADARRRALKAGATVETFSNSEVFARDNWTCGICSTNVDRLLAYPDPMSASLDHVVPLSLGGDHSRANTRCSHLTCNVQRGNRVA